MPKDIKISFDKEDLEEVRNGLIVLLQKQFQVKEVEFSEKETTAFYFVLKLLSDIS